MENEIILFEDQGVKLEVNMKDETVWLTQTQMSELFKKARSTINEHIKTIYETGELVESETMTKFGNSEFSDKPTNYYNLDMILSVGYRVNSKRGILLRIMYLLMEIKELQLPYSFIFCSSMIYYIEII